MPPLAKEDIAFFFGAVNQGKGKRNLQRGELIEAINVRQLVEDEYRKRPGFDRVVPTAASGSFTASAESFVSDGKSQLARDGADAVWRLSGSTWQARGTAKRAYPKIFPSQLAADARNPITVFDGTNYWVFCHVLNNGFTYTLFDSSGNIVQAATAVTGSDLVSIAGASDGTYVWVLTAGSTTVTSYKFTIASPSTAPTTATYTTTTNQVRGIDMHKLDNSDIAVAITDNVTSGAAQSLYVSYLDTATGQKKSSPALVKTGAGGSANSSNIGQPSIVNYGGANGSWYVLLWTSRGSDYTGQSASAYNLALATITSSTLATSLRGLTTTSDATVSRTMTVGYRDGSGNIIVFYTQYTDSGSPTYPVAYQLMKGTWTGSAYTEATLRRYSYPVSKPQAVGSTYYLLTGYDDGLDAASFERSYFLIDSSGNIITQLGYAQAPPAGLWATSGNGLSTRAYVTPLLVSGNKLYCSLLMNQGSGGGSNMDNDYAPALAIVDFAASYSAPTKARHGIAAWPGGCPMIAGTSDSQIEAAPLLSPVNATYTKSGSDLAGPSVFQYVYRIIQADGTILRSAPSPADSQTFKNSANSAIVKPLTHLMPGTVAQIEIYLSPVSSTQPTLYTVVANNTAVDTITVVLPAATFSGSETVYTYGGGLDNAPLPASLWVSSWRNRLMVGSGSEIWPSLEREDGHAHRFNESLVTSWDDGEGDIICGAPVDWNYFAVFKRDAVGVISGGGPNATPGGGVAGNYEVQTLRIRKGLINNRSILTGPGGCYFQSLADGRIYCVTPGLEVQDVSKGMESYRAGTVVAVNYAEKDRQLHFHMSDGTILVLDYAHPTPEQPYGRWTKWSSTGLNAACGALIDTTGVPVHLEAVAGAIRTPGTGWTDATSGAAASVLMALTTGDLATAGQIKGAYRLDALDVLGEWIATNTIKVSVTSDYGDIATTHTSSSLTAGPEEAYIRPAGHHRVQSTKVKFEETVSAGEGFVFTGLSLTIQRHGRAKFPGSTRRVA